MNLETTYLGLKLANPLVVGASPFCDSMQTARELQDAGAAAVVMRSLFEEQIEAEVRALAHQIESTADSFAEATSYFPNFTEYQLAPDQYLRQIDALKGALTIPIIASLNGARPGGWIDYARRFEAAGADAVELNLYQLVTRAGVLAGEVESDMLDIVRQVCASVKIPVAVKLSPFHTSPSNFALALEHAGAAGVVFFNRFYQPDFDLDEMEVLPQLRLSDPSELLLRLRWLAIVSPQVRLSLAASGGVHSSTDALKAIFAGAHAVQVVSALLRHGPHLLPRLLEGMRHWMEEHGYSSIDEFRGAMNLLALIAPPGMGKTTLIFHLIERWRNTAHTAFLFQTQCDSREMFRCLLSDLGIQSEDQNLAHMHEQLNQALLGFARSGKRFILFIDEAQNLADSVLETVRLLSDFETPQAKLMQIVLVGQPQLADKLRHASLTQLRQRISIVSRLEPLSPAETAMYVNHRLITAGHSGTPIFSNDALAMIAVQSGGIPRNINNLCFNALSMGFVKGQKQIDSHTMEEILSDLNFGLLGTSGGGEHYLSPVASALVDSAWYTERTRSEIDAAVAPRIEAVPAASRDIASEPAACSDVQQESIARGISVEPPQAEMHGTGDKYAASETSAGSVAVLELPRAGTETEDQSESGVFFEAPSLSQEAIVEPEVMALPSVEDDSSDQPAAPSGKFLGALSFAKSDSTLAWELGLRRARLALANCRRICESWVTYGLVAAALMLLPVVFLRHGKTSVQATPLPALGLSNAVAYSNRGLTKQSGVPDQSLASTGSDMRTSGSVTTEPSVAPSDLGLLTVMVEPNQTLSELSNSYLGLYNEEVLREIRDLNPQVKNPDLIVAGQPINFPRESRKAVSSMRESSRLSILSGK